MHSLHVRKPCRQTICKVNTGGSLVIAVEELRPQQQIPHDRACRTPSTKRYAHTKRLRQELTGHGYDDNRIHGLGSTPRNQLISCDGMHNNQHRWGRKSQLANPQSRARELRLSLQWRRQYGIEPLRMGKVHESRIAMINVSRSLAPHAHIERSVLWHGASCIKYDFPWFYKTLTKRRLV